MLQFDSDQITSGDDLEQVQQAVDHINGVLQREPYGLGAQLMVTAIDDDDVSSDDDERGEEE